MMKKKMLTQPATTFAVFLTVIGLLVTQSATASGNPWPRPGKSVFDGHIYFCAPLMPPVSVVPLPGDKEIRTFVNIGNVWLTGNELVDGIEENEVRALFDTSGEFDIPILTRISLLLEPHEFDGRWYMRQLITTGPDGDSGRGFGFGTGDLRGKFAWFSTGNIEIAELDFPPEESPCGPTARVPLSGKIISFNWIS